MDDCFSYEFGPYRYRVYQPKPKPGQSIPRLRPVPRSLQLVEVSILLRRERIRHYCLANAIEPCIPELSLVTRRFHYDHLKDHDLAYEILGEMIASLEIDPDSVRSLIDEIIDQGIEMGYLPRNRTLKILPLHVELDAWFIEHINLRPLLRRRAMEESAILEFQRRNNGMVPAKKSSVKKMLKRIRVESGESEEGDEESNKKRRVSAGESCVICLEKLKESSVAAQMPCSHTFHGACITKWLNQSHYCPVCRFEMPKELSGPRS